MAYAGANRGSKRGTQVAHRSPLESETLSKHQRVLQDAMRIQVMVQEKESRFHNDTLVLKKLLLRDDPKSKEQARRLSQSCVALKRDIDTAKHDLKRIQTVLATANKVQETIMKERTIANAAQLTLATARLGKAALPQIEQTERAYVAHTDELADVIEDMDAVIEETKHEFVNLDPTADMSLDEALEELGESILPASDPLVHVEYAGPDLLLTDMPPVPLEPPRISVAEFELSSQQQTTAQISRDGEELSSFSL